MLAKGVVKCGGFRYEDGTRYIGDWNHKGQKHGMGHLLLSGILLAITCNDKFESTSTLRNFVLRADGTRYDGAFRNGLCSGLGVMHFRDGAK